MVASYDNKGSLMVGVVFGMALPSAAMGKGEHKKAGGHGAEKGKESKDGKPPRLAKHEDVTPVSAVAPVAAAEPEPAPAPEPKAAASSPSLEPVLGHKVQQVTPHEASNFATQATDDENPGKKK